jgi:YfiH family protein
MVAAMRGMSVASIPNPMIFGMTPQPNDGFVWVQAAGGPALRCAALEPHADHLFTTRPWRLGSPGAVNGDGWSDVAAALRVEAPNLTRLHQVHGSTVVIANANGHRSLPQADIQLTDDADLAMAVQTADCLPILLADPRTGAIAAAHAGWRGLAARVPEVVVSALEQEFGTRAGDVIVAIGPAIGPCCYEVGADVRDAIARAGFDDRELARCFFDDSQPTMINPSMPSLSSTRRADHWFFDGLAVARRQLERAGVTPDRIHATGLCTASHPDLFCSYRRDGRPAGRMAGAIRRR